MTTTLSGVDLENSDIVGGNVSGAIVGGCTINTPTINGGTANLVAISGGSASGIGISTSTIDSTTIGGVTPSTANFVTPASSDNSQKAATTAWAKAGFAVSLAANGYLQLPTWLGGLIIQWGSANAASSSLNIGLPINFPNNLWNFQAMPLNFGPNAGRSNPYLTSVNNGNPAPISSVQLASAGSTNSVFWFAIGN